jgi:hypothetical protein
MWRSLLRRQLKRWDMPSNSAKIDLAATSRKKLMLESSIAISPIAHANLIQLAETVGEPVQAVLDKAIEEYRRQIFLRQLSQDFAELRKDPVLWQEELAERQAWDVTLMDGVDDE